MILKTTNLGSNYLAKVVRISNVRKHPNADRLQLCTVDNQTIVVGLNAKEGDEYIYFPIESKINSDFLRYTNSYSDPLLNADGKSKGFFNDKGRVKAVKLRGTPSEGYLAPVSQLQSWLGLNPTEWAEANYEGTEFDTIENFLSDGDIGSKHISILLCEKYVPRIERAKGPANTPKKDKTRRFDRMVPGQFHFHVDTSNLKKNIHDINPNDTITISEKLHGTSVVVSNILVKRKLNWVEKICRFFGGKVQETDYDVIYSSRNVLKNQYLYDDKTPNHWYKEDIWALAKDKIGHTLTPGLSIYAEIVGYLPSGGMIQKGYDYGCKPGEFEVYVYRMTQVDPAGNLRELTTNQIKAHCDRHGLKMVPIHFYGTGWNFFPSGYNPEPWRDSFLNILVDRYLEKKCGMCHHSVPAEGIVVTVERDNFTAYKLKSFAFLEGESKELDSGTVDIETEQSQEV